MTARESSPVSAGGQDDLAAAFDAYFETVSKIHTIATRRDDDDPLKLIALRRELAGQLQEMNHEIIDTARIASLDSDSVIVLTECKAMLSAERAAVAEHQARWSAPAMHRDRAGYERDTAMLFRLHLQNHCWRKNVLLPKLAVIRRRTLAQRQKSQIRA